MRIRTATLADRPRIRTFFSPIVSAGTTFTFPTDLAEPEGRHWWLLRQPARTAVALDRDGTVLGSAKMNRNHGGNAAHIASASYMVDPAHEGKGAGRAPCEDSLEWARSAGYRAMRFNAVVESNTRALSLYRLLGFEIVGTLPDGFAHPEHGDVGLHILYRRL